MIREVGLLILDMIFIGLCVGTIGMVVIFGLIAKLIKEIIKYFGGK